MHDYLIGMLAVPMLTLGWITVQQFARLFARRHPELGPLREEGGGCGSGDCSCSAEASCPQGARGTSIDSSRISQSIDSGALREKMR